jgi:uncharacterized protein (TIGR01777 family)
MTEIAVLDIAVTLLIAQGLMGAFDTLYHHEMTVALPQRHGARLELAIHAVRAILYGVVFAGIAHLGFHGLWAWVLAAVVLVEVLLTLWDFVVEDNSRKLPATERVLHTVLAINGGALFGLYGVQLAQWASLPTALVPIDLGWRGWVLTLFAVGVAASGVRDGIAALRLSRQTPAPNPFAQMPHQRVLLTGGTGFIGEALVQQLLDAGHQVTVLTRQPLNAAFLFAGRARCIPTLARLHASDAFDAVINLAGARIVGMPWTQWQKKRLLNSRLHTTQQLLQWAQRTQHKPAVWVQASGIGYYGVRPPEETLTEQSAPGQGFMTELCQQWEQAAAPATTLGIRQVVLRLGMVLGPGGALPPMLLPHRLGLGGRLGSGQQAMGWIHREDVLAIMAQALVQPGMQGTYNTVAPECITQATFATTVGQVLHRPVWLHMPAAPIRWLAGEMAQIFVDGQKAVPQRLLDANFAWRYPTLRAALQNLV